LPSEINRIAPVHVHRPILPETVAIHDQALNKMIHAGIFQFVAVSLVEFGAVKLQTLQK
jgi:hypothetical protein